MNNNVPWRIAFFALLGAACLLLGQLMAKPLYVDQSISITIVLDVLYKVIVGITFDPIFGDSAKFGPDGSAASILINFGRFLLPATFIYALYRFVPHPYCQLVGSLARQLREEPRYNHWNRSRRSPLRRQLIKQNQQFSLEAHPSAHR